MKNRAVKIFKKSRPKRVTGFILAALLGFLTPIAGCHSSKIRGLVPGEGTVVYDGLPLAWVSLSFSPEDKSKPNVRMATAMTDDEGRFILTTLGNRGILPGTYIVTAEKYLPNEGAETVETWAARRRDAEGREPKPEETVFQVVTAIPLSYSYANESDLRAEIGDKGDRTISIELNDE